MRILKEALQRKKQQELLRRELKQKQVLHDIKDIFLDASIFLGTNEDK